jgi:hypothetical protein
MGLAPSLRAEVPPSVRRDGMGLAPSRVADDDPVPQGRALCYHEMAAGRARQTVLEIT